MIYDEKSSKHNFDDRRIFEEVWKSAFFINDHTCAEEPPISCIQFVPVSPAVKFPVTKRSPSRLGGHYDDDHGDNDDDDW